jgi:hypothetical protein
MAYTETSDYGYITGDELEAYSGIDYSAVHATKFSEALVMGKVTIAEKMINAYLGVDGAQTITDGIEACTLIISAKILHQNLIGIGFHDKDEHKLELVDMSISAILRMFLRTDVGVDAIPMSGADR